MVISKSAQEMQDCIPYIKKLSAYNLDKEDSFNSLSKLSKEEIMCLMTIMEIGRDHYLMDAYRPRTNPELVYSKHKRVTLRTHQNKSKTELVHCILDKLLLYRYMETAFSVLGLHKIKC